MMDNNSKQINVTKSSLPDFNDYVSLVGRIWDTNQLTNFGPMHRLLQEQLSSYLGISELEIVSSGHLALELALEVLGLTGEIITTPFTFVSTTNAIIRRGLTPVFCDINLDDYTIDTSKIESLITSRTSGILAVHVYGNICDVIEIERIAKKHNLRVIYDAAHSFGISYLGKSILTYGDISITSFHAAKVFNSVEGGALVVNTKINHDIKSIINFGIGKDGISDYPGPNGKMSEFHAVVGILNLKAVDNEIHKRKVVAERYDSNLSSIKGIRMSKNRFNIQSNFSYYTILVDPMISNRDSLLSYLRERGIMARKYFWPLSSNLFNLSNDQKKSNSNAEYISNNIISLPIYGDLSIQDVDYISKLISFFILTD